MDVDTFSGDRWIPERIKREALHSDADGEGDGVADYNGHCELDREPEVWGGKYTEVEEQDRELGNILDERVENLRDVVELGCQHVNGW